MNTGFDLDLRQLDGLLRAEGIDPSIINAINSYLIGLGDAKGLADARDLISGQSGMPPFAVADVLNVTSSGAIKIQTAAGDQLIVVPNGATNVHVAGHTEALVVAGDADGVSLSDEYHARFDTLRAGTGDDDILRTRAESSSLKGGSGHGDWLFARTASLDTLIAGSGGDQTLVAGRGNYDYLKGGSGYGDALGSAGGSASLYAGSGGDQTLSAVGASARLQGGSGGGLTMVARGADATMLTGTATGEFLSSAGHDTSIYAGGAGRSGDGSGTLISAYNAKYHIGASGSDTISGGSNGGTIFFDAQAYGTGSGISIATQNSVTTVQFTDTQQSFQIFDVARLHFSDGQVVHI